MTEVTGFRASPQQASCWSSAANHPYWAILQLQIDGPCDRDFIARRLKSLVESEEILRTRLCAVPGMALPIQQIDASAPADLHHDNSAMGDDCPLYASLRQVGEERHVLTLRAPATHADTASLRLIAAQLVARSANGERLQYADYAEWKNSVQGAADSPGVQYWQQRLAEPAPPIWDRKLAPGQFAPQSVALAPIETAAIQRQCTALGCTAEQWLAAAWMILLSRLSGQALVEIGYVDACRGDSLDSALGLFQQAIPVRSRIDHALSLRAQIGSLRDAARLALGWRDFHDGGAAPNIALVCVDDAPWTGAIESGVSILQEQCVAQRFSLRLAARVGTDSIACALDFDARAWDTQSLQLLGEQWHQLVSALAADCDSPTGAIALLGPLQSAIVEGPGQAWHSKPVSIVDMIERQAEAYPSAPALADISATLSYGAMNKQANQLAHRLIQNGVAPGDIVGIVLPRCNDMIVSILAVLKAGAAYLALDPGYPSERLAFMAQDSGARHVIGYGAQPGQAPHVTIAIDETMEQPLTNPAVVSDLALPAYLIYTSGSSGTPKAVEVSHRSLSQSTQVRMAFYPTPVRAYLLLSSFSFDSSVAGIFWTLAQGGKLVLPASGDELVLDTLCHLIERHSISHGLSLPSLYGALLEHAPSSALASIGTWIVAGEACTDALVTQHHGLLPRARLVNEYGPTEGGVWASAEVLEPGRPAGIGRPIPGMALDLINEHGAPAAIGETGEIYLAGDQLATGYRGHPEQTAAAFARIHGRRTYRTGDLACWNADGTLRFLGRRDHQVKIRGHRVELGEIERHLLGHGEIADAVVIAQEHAGGKRLLAYFTARHAPPDEGALRNYLAERVPAYMVPALFISLRAMPLTPNGKRDLNALPDPDTVREQYVAPRNRLEQELADICAGVLRLPRFGITDNFFQAGGDSILSLQVVTRASRSGITLSTRQVFEHQTVQAMAAVAEWRQAEDYATDVGWLQSWTDPAMLEAFASCAAHYRMDAGDVLSAALARVMLTNEPFRLVRSHDGGSGQYVTYHAFGPADTGWETFAHEAKAVLRREAETGMVGDACLSVREHAVTPLADQPARAQAPLQLSATVLPHALTLAWSADSAHYTTERLQQFSTAIAQGLQELAQHCAANTRSGLQTQDFPAAGLDQAALEELLAELNSADSAS